MPANPKWIDPLDSIIRLRHFRIVGPICPGARSADPRTKERV